ncbi:MAG: GYD domain-containing protein [Rhodocyclales bacterium]|nr:GYD domain-containing protein [Rhodocyclales bacterium]
MTTYVILSRLAPDSFKDTKEFKRTAATVAEMIKSQCPGVKWKESYAALGRFDVVDIVEAKDVKDVEKAAMLIRAYGHATTETLQATPWHAFVDAL